MTVGGRARRPGGSSAALLVLGMIGSWGCGGGAPPRQLVTPSLPPPAKPRLVSSCTGTRDAASAAEAARICDLTLREMMALLPDDRARWISMFREGCAPVYSNDQCRLAWERLDDASVPLAERVSHIDAVCAMREEPVPATYANRIFLMKHREILACDGGNARVASYVYARVELERRFASPGRELHLWLDRTADDGYVFWSVDGTVELGVADPTAALFEETIFDLGGEDLAQTALVVYLSSWTFPLVDELKEAVNKLPFRAVLIVPP